MSDLAHKTFIAREAAIILENMFAQSKSLRLNHNALNNLIIDNDTGQPFDFVGDWKYSPAKFPEVQDEMLRHHNHMEKKKLQVCMSVPSQIRRLYNANRLKLVEGDDGLSTLQVDESASQRNVKKLKRELVIF